MNFTDKETEKITKFVTKWFKKMNNFDVVKNQKWNYSIDDDGIFFTDEMYVFKDEKHKIEFSVNVELALDLWDFTIIYNSHEILFKEKNFTFIELEFEKYASVSKFFNSLKEEVDKFATSFSKCNADVKLEVGKMFRGKFIKEFGVE